MAVLTITLTTHVTCSVLSLIMPTTYKHIQAYTHKHITHDPCVFLFCLANKCTHSHSLSLTHTLSLSLSHTHTTQIRRAHVHVVNDEAAPPLGNTHTGSPPSDTHTGSHSGNTYTGPPWTAATIDHGWIIGGDCMGNLTTMHMQDSVEGLVNATEKQPLTFHRVRVLTNMCIRGLHLCHTHTHTQCTELRWRVGMHTPMQSQVLHSYLNLPPPALLLPPPALLLVHKTQCCLLLGTPMGRYSCGQYRYHCTHTTQHNTSSIHTHQYKHTLYMRTCAIHTIHTVIHT